MNIRHPLPASYMAMSLGDLRESMNVAVHKIADLHDVIAQSKSALDEATASAARWQTSYDGAVRENKNGQAAYNLMKIESEKNADLLAVRDSEIEALKDRLLLQEEALLNEREERRATYLNRHENESRSLWSTTFTASIRNGDSGTQAGHKADDAIYQFNLKFQPKAPASST